MKDLKKSFKSRSFRMGGYQTLVMVIVIVLVIVLNLVVNKLNITVDLSSDKKFTLTEETKKLAENIKDDIKFYYMCQEGNQMTQIEKVLDQYDGLGNIEVIDKDPVVYPNFASEYIEDEIQDNDVIVVNESNNRSKVVAGTDMLVQDMDYMTYQQTYTLDAEGQLTAALQNVTSDSAIKLYYTSGHNEKELDSSFTDILSKTNVDRKELTTSSENSIPEDCEILLIDAPEYDLNEDEYTMISEYLKNGGKAMFFLNPAVTDTLTNYYKLLQDYGVNVIDGYVIDSEGAYNERYPTVLAPTVADHDITNDVDSRTQVIMPVGKGMTTQSDVRSTLTIEPLLTTTESAYSRVDYTSQSLEKEKNDISGPFNVAVAIKDVYSENTQGKGKATQIVVYGSGDFGAADFIATNLYGNRSMILNSIAYLHGEETSTLAIPTRSLSQEMVSIEEGDRIFFTVLLVVIIPLSLLGVGFAIWFRRRKS